MHRDLFLLSLTNRGSESVRYWVTTSSYVQLNRSYRFMEVQDMLLWKFRVYFGLKEGSNHVFVLYVQRGRRSLCRSGLCSWCPCCSHWVGATLFVFLYIKRSGLISLCLCFAWKSLWWCLEVRAVSWFIIFFKYIMCQLKLLFYLIN